jgi:hypothetical protein
MPQKKKKAPRRAARRRAPARRCDCETRTEYRFASELLPIVREKLYRYVLVVRSKCSCDTATPDHCQYNYWFEVKIEERLINQENEAEGPWQDSLSHPGIHKSAEILDAQVNAKLEHVPPLTAVLRHTAWRPLAPETLATPVIVQVAPGPGSREVTTVRETPELCVPRVPNPTCPEYV